MDPTELLHQVSFGHPAAESHFGFPGFSTKTSKPKRGKHLGKWASGPQAPTKLSIPWLRPLEMGPPVMC